MGITSKRNCKNLQKMYLPSVSNWFFKKGVWLLRPKSSLLWRSRFFLQWKFSWLKKTIDQQRFFLFKFCRIHWEKFARILEILGRWTSSLIEISNSCFNWIVSDLFVKLRRSAGLAQFPGSMGQHEKRLWPGTYQWRMPTEQWTAIPGRARWHASTTHHTNPIVRSVILSCLLSGSNCSPAQLIARAPVTTQGAGHFHY